jgi:hypothetical protein
VSTLAINHKDQMSFSQISLEIFQDTKNNLQQPSVLQKDEIGSIYEVGNMQRQSHLQLEQQEEIVVLDPVIADLEDFISLSYVSFSPKQKDSRVLNAADFTHELSYLPNQL